MGDSIGAGGKQPQVIDPRYLNDATLEFIEQVDGVDE